MLSVRTASQIPSKKPFLQIVVIRTVLVFLLPLLLGTLAGSLLNIDAVFAAAASAAVTIGRPAPPHRTVFGVDVVGDSPSVQEHLGTPGKRAVYLDVVSIVTAFLVPHEVVCWKAIGLITNIILN